MNTDDDDGSANTGGGATTIELSRTSFIVEEDVTSVADVVSSASSYTLLKPQQQQQPHHIQPKVQSSNVTAFVTLLKALFGVSLLSSPRVLGETGILLGTVVYSLILMACVASCWCLLQARAKVVASEAQNPPRTAFDNSNNNSDGRSTPPSLALNHQQHSNVTTANVITYGDLGRKLLGAKESVVINFLIVSLHICFGAGLVASSMHQIAIVLDWEVDYDKEEYDNNDADQQEGDYDTEDYETEDTLGGRIMLSAILFPIVCILLQFRNVKDLFWVCLSGLVVFLVGCIGTMLYSTFILVDDNDNSGDGSSSTSIWDVPHDAFEWKWRGVPNFVASTLCAMEGINLALPIANHYLATPLTTATNVNKSGTCEAADATDNDDDAPIRSPVPIVTGAVSCFGVMTLLVAYLGYLSGLGGGSGTKHEGDDDGQPDCPTTAYCLDSSLLETIHRLSLACTLILTLPIILYPSLELLELWAEERNRQLRTGKTSSNRTLGDSWTGFVWGAPSDSAQRMITFESKLFGDQPIFPGLHRHWRYRISHAAAVCLLAIVDRQHECQRALVLYKGIGLSIACFLLPVILFIRAYSLAVVLQNPRLTATLVGLLLLGGVNFVLVILSVFTVHNFLPTEIHDDPMHHHEDG